MENSEVVQLYLDDIIPNRFQPREVFNDQALKELAISIREHGVIQPILVRKFGEKYEIIAGERRYKASTMAGLTKIPAIVKNLDDKESSKVALIENLQRRDLTPIEEARTYQKILDLDEMTQEELAKTMGKSQSAVSNKLRLLSLPDEIQEALLKEEISERHARSLLNVEDKNVQLDLLKEIVNNKMTVRELDSKIKKLSSDGSSEDETTGGSSVVNEIKEEKEVQEEVINKTSIDLFKEPDSSETEKLFDNENNSNSLFEEKVENKEENNSSLFEDNTKVDSMENNSLFSDTSISEVKSDLFSSNSDSLFNDPTTVDINKIREESTDINLFASSDSEKESTDIKSLLNPDGFKKEEPTGFVKNFEDEKEPEKIDNNEVIGNGLLAGMPVIKPVEVEEDKKESAFSSLFDTPKEEIKDDLNDLFGGSSNQNAINNESVVSTSNVQLAVNDVKDVIKSYQEKGYTVTVEELDLDREIQLIVKFNKN
ncbi:MAG: ParB/RepB/Spo0J family partition protein [Firmicutes bacterium]|nr:ParB/RepB/Spo0J family partition protein [Bacillota bacterium]